VPFGSIQMLQYQIPVHGAATLAAPAANTL